MSNNNDYHKKNVKNFEDHYSYDNYNKRHFPLTGLGKSEQIQIIFQCITLEYILEKFAGKRR